jgi:pimeloyl-ACP methyl ester carboxylesterase
MMRAMLLAALAGCGGSEEASPPREQSDAAVVVDVAVAEDAVTDAAATLLFTLCPAGYSGACARVDAPLDHAAPSGKTVKLLINRLSTSQGAKAQLWMLQGGPGGSAADLTQLGLTAGRALDGVDVYLFEHRGVGGSDRLACPGEPMFTSDEEAAAWWKKCAADLTAKWGSLEKFSTTQAAHDLGWAIDRVKKPGQKVFVYGVSYGTYWAQRYLQVRGDQPDGVVLDSVVSPGVQYLSRFDEQFDYVGKKLAARCAADALCKSKLGDDPWARVQGIMTKVRAKTCAAAPEETGHLVNALLQGWGMNGIAFAALYRYERCSATDVAALKRLRDVIAGGAPINNPRWSQAVFFNVAFSELWESPSPTAEVLRARFDAATLPAGVFGQKAIETFWPKYPRDSYVDKFPTTTKPVLVLNGELDAQTTMATAIAAKPVYSKPGQAFVEIPGGNHGVVMASPVVDPEEPACGMQIMNAWLKSPSSTPSTTCFKDLAPLSFDGDPGMVTYFFGRPNAWEEAPTAPSGFKWSKAQIDRSLQIVREAYGRSKT